MTRLCSVVVKENLQKKVVLQQIILPSFLINLYENHRGAEK